MSTPSVIAATSTTVAPIGIFDSGLGGLSACVAALFGLPWLFWPDWRMGVAACVALVLVRAWAARYFVKRIGGYTGDCLGFTQQLCELAIYLVVLGWTSS